MVKGIPENEPFRDYYAPVIEVEKRDIAYIVNTLSRATIFELPALVSDLQKAGDRISNLHPLKFLETIFTDKDLLVSIKKIKGIAWNRFYKNIADSLKEEVNRDNLKKEYAISFADILKIDSNIIVPLISNKQWKNLLTELKKIEIP